MLDERLNEPATTTQVAVNVDVPRFLDMFMTKLSAFFKEH